MKFYTAYYRRRKAETVSLLVQQATVGKRLERVLFAGVIVSEKRDFAGEECIAGLVNSGLADFFSEELIPMVLKYSDKALERLEKRMLKKKPAEKQKGTCSVAIIVCVGERALLIARGDCRIYLLGKRFSKPYIECLKAEEGTQVVLEPGAKILLTTEAVEEQFPEDAVLSCLGKENINGERQLARRLEDLGRLECHRSNDCVAGRNACVAGKENNMDGRFAMIAVCCVEEGRNVE